MSRRRKFIGMAALCAIGGGGLAQQPQANATVEAVRLQTKQPEKKDDSKKDEKKKDDPKQPPPVTLPATTTQAPNIPLGTAESSVQVTSLPPVYGDLFSTGFYSPYLQARTPNGQITSVLPGQTAVFPIGTDFTQNVPTQIIRVQTGTITVIPPGSDFPIQVPVFENRIQVVGPPAQANFGGIPVTVARGAFKIAENESPRPVDRFYVNYSYFYDVNPSLNVPELPRMDVHRETIGLEKTFFGGNASIGFRLPILQVHGAPNVDRDTMGDLSIVFKYAFINEWLILPDGTQVGGNVLSAGMVVTAPTGGAATYTSIDPEIHSTLLQPWLGGIYVRGNAYVQGFSSVAVPTDARDTTFMFNSLQLGYTIYRSPASRLITSVTPIVEAHITTPFANQGITRLPVGTADIVSFTGGATIGLGRWSALNIGSNSPVTGPRPYGLEAMAQLNIRY